MQINISQILEYQSCPIRWHNKYIAKRSTPPGAALSDGTYWHKLAEAYLNGESLLPVAENPVQDRMREFVEEGKLPKYPTLGTEVKLRMPLGRHELVGALDGIMPDSDLLGYFLSLQWKTCEGGQDSERQCDAVKYSYHEVAYEALMNYNGYPCSGTFLGIYKKLTKADLAAAVNPYSAHYLRRDPAYVAKVLREIEIIANEMDDRLHDNRLRPQRRTCIQGRIRCQFWATCYDGIPLSDERYVDAEDRYAKPSEDS